MTKLPFTKMSGAGNDFILIEGKPRPSTPELARRLCDRRGSVGADGLLVLARGRGRSPHKMVYFNADGSRTFCANGARCSALWLHKRGWAGLSFSFLSDSGTVEARIQAPGRARVRMPAPSAGRWLNVKSGGKSYKGWFVDTGVPHFVVPVPDPEKTDVEGLGRALRFHHAFGRSGTNVDFLRWGKPLRLRTYERGVEAETLACGTGVVAAALCALAEGKAKAPVAVQTRGGDLLKVDRGADGSLWLEGPGSFSFEGTASV